MLEKRKKWRKEIYKERKKGNNERERSKEKEEIMDVKRNRLHKQWQPWHLTPKRLHCPLVTSDILTCDLSANGLMRNEHGILPFSSWAKY